MMKSAQQKLCRFSDRRKSPKGLFRRNYPRQRLAPLPYAFCLWQNARCAHSLRVTKAKPLSSTLAWIEVFFAPAKPWQKTYFNSHFPSENDFLTG